LRGNGPRHARASVNGEHLAERSCDMKRTEWNRIQVTGREGAGLENVETEWFFTRENTGKRTHGRRPARLNIQGLRDAVWEGF